MEIEENKTTGFCKEIQIKYEKCLREVGENDPYVGPDTLGIHDVLMAHYSIGNFFYLEGSGMSDVGPRDLNLLHSALYRQHASFRGVKKWKDIFDICATLLFGIAKGHAFHDGNKRTGFLSALYYLYKRGRIPKENYKEFEDFTVMIADNKLSRFSRYNDMIRRNEDDAEVHFISHYLKSKTRDIDKKVYTITYKDLKRILNNFGFDLEDPKGNYINVVKSERKKTWFLREITATRRVAQIGFPGWTRQVGRKDILIVRKETGLTHENGIDSQSFFNGVDDLQKLIAHYQEPLRNLANR